MWVFVGIVAFLLLLITIILLLPFSVIIKNDEKDEVIILYKILFKTFGENPDPNQPIVKTLKEISGVSRLSKQNPKETSNKDEFITILRDDISLIMGLLKRLLGLLKQCKIKTLKIDITCAEDDAAKTAINYGICYAVISPLLNFLHGTMKVCKKGEKINISTDFDGEEAVFKFETILVTRVFRLIIALFYLALDEAKRINKNYPTAQK